MTTDSQPDRGSTYWAVVVADGICGAVIEITPEERRLITRWPIFETEAAAVSYVLERAESLAGYWERQTDLLRRRLHEIAMRGEGA